MTDTDIHESIRTILLPNETSEDFQDYIERYLINIGTPEHDLSNKEKRKLNKRWMETLIILFTRAASLAEVNHSSNNICSMYAALSDSEDKEWRRIIISSIFLSYVIGRYQSRIDMLETMVEKD